MLLLLSALRAEFMITRGELASGGSPPLGFFAVLSLLRLPELECRMGNGKGVFCGVSLSRVGPPPVKPRGVHHNHPSAEFYNHPSSHTFFGLPSIRYTRSAGWWPRYFTVRNIVAGG